MIRMTGPHDAVPRLFPVSSLHPHTAAYNSCQTRPRRVYFADRLALEKLPPYAPMLNPVESLWSWLKWERLSNFGPQDAHELDARLIAELTAVREDQAFLRNLFHASDLPLPRALLS